MFNLSRTTPLSDPSAKIAMCLLLVSHLLIGCVLCLQPILPTFCMRHCKCAVFTVTMVVLAALFGMQLLAFKAQSRGLDYYWLMGNVAVFYVALY